MFAYTGAEEKRTTERSREYEKATIHIRKTLTFCMSPPLLGSALRGITAYPTLSHHVKRLLAAGFDAAKAHTMAAFYRKLLDEAERYVSQHRSRGEGGRGSLRSRNLGKVESVRRRCDGRACGIEDGREGREGGLGEGFRE